jgi:tetratricopeptide (TPR) repeat protein
MQRNEPRVQKRRAAPPIVAPARPSPKVVLPTFEEAIPSPDEQSTSLVTLLQEGRLHEADGQIAASVSRARRRVSGNGLLFARIDDRRDAVGWMAMRALLDGRRDDARVALDELGTLAQSAKDAEPSDRYWLQRLAYLLDWGDGEEHYEVLDHCRERAYRYGDVPWRARLTLLLAHMGRADEAGHDLEATLEHIDGAPHDRAWLDIVTNLAQAAAMVGDFSRAGVLHKFLTRRPEKVVVVGGGWWCKGSPARFRALLAAGLGKWKDCDNDFAAAAELHRALGARPLLARTLDEWGRSLNGRDDIRARSCLQEAAQLASELDLPALTAERASPAHGAARDQAS